MWGTMLDARNAEIQEPFSPSRTHKPKRSRASTDKDSGARICATVEISSEGTEKFGDKSECTELSLGVGMYGESEQSLQMNLW